MQVRGNQQTGTYTFETKKKRRGEVVTQRMTAAVFVLEVQRELPAHEWPESDTRKRRWMPARRAFALLKHDWQRRAMEDAGLVT